MKKIVGKVTEEEKLTIWEINGHKNALEELLPILPKESPLYVQASKDMNETLIKYQEWWNTQYKKYHWEKGEKNWKIIFDTNEIVLEF